MYPRSRYYQGRKQAGPLNYLMPFLIIICVGIIGILLFNLWRAFFPSEKVRAAYLHIIEGSGQMKAWGTDSFFNLSGDAVIMQGDQIRSSADAKIIVEFFNGSLMRMDGNTDVSFDAIDDGNTPKIELRLYDGNVWFNLLDKGSGGTDLRVKADNLLAISGAASVFELENGEDQLVRVFGVFENEGLSVDIFSEDGDAVVETENIGVGQQIIFTAEVLKRYFAHQSPTVLAAVDDDFKQTPWYLWNVKEDDQPTRFEKTVGPAGTSFVRVEPQIIVGEEVEAGATDANGNVVAPDSANDSAGEVSKDEKTPGTDKKETVASTNAGIGKPTITSVAGGTKLDAQGKYQVTSRVTTLTGAVSGVEKMVVNGYTLQKFKPGDTSWTYFANADFDLMKAGDNVYEIYGLDASGNKTESLVIKVFYTPQGVNPEAASVPMVTPATEAL